MNNYYDEMTNHYSSVDNRCAVFCDLLSFRVMPVASKFCH